MKMEFKITLNDGTIHSQMIDTVELIDCAAWNEKQWNAMPNDDKREIIYDYAQQMFLNCDNIDEMIRDVLVNDNSSDYESAENIF